MSDYSWMMASAILAACVGVGVAFAAQDTRPAVDAAAQGVADGNTRFALDLYGRLRQEPGNLFCSPLSLSTVLALTYAGARGNTAAEMARTLHFDLPPDKLHPAFGGLLSSLVAPPQPPPYRLDIANALWLDQHYKFLPEFLAIGQSDYRAGLETVDFRGATDAARQTINAWVAQRTEDKIKELIQPGILSPVTRLVLTNAIYFKGSWAAKFDPKETRDAPFTLLDGKQVQVPSMNQTAAFGYFEQPDVQGLELPYAGDRLSMVVLLPRKPAGLAELEQALNAKSLAAWLATFGEPGRTTKVQVALPRFTLSQAFRMDQVLNELGMRDAFRPDAADFSGMDGTRLLYIGAVLHQAYVDVNEEGTEAAGASAVVMKMRATPQAPPVFRADHPFLFLIRDRQTGSVLFIGRVMNPKP